jgi:hypothetical protein
MFWSRFQFTNVKVSGAAAAMRAGARPNQQCSSSRYRDGAVSITI